MGVFVAGTAQAQSNLFWDANGGTAGTGGTGTWNTTDLTWRNGSATGALQAWANGNRASLGGTAGTLTLANDIAFAGSSQLGVSTAGYTINNAAGSTTSGNSLTFNTGTSTGNSIIGPEATVNVTINAPLVLTGSTGGNAAVAFRLSGGTFTVNGDISGDRGLSLENNGGSGFGRLVLNGNNSFTGVAGQTTFKGGVSVSSGTLVVGSDTALGTGNLYWLNAGRLEAGNGNRTVANTVTFANDPNIVFNGTNSLTFTKGVQYFPSSSAQFTVTEAAATLTFSSLTESFHYANGPFTKLGAGTLAITGTYGNGGQTTVSAGALLINGTTGDRTNDSPVTFTGQKNYSVAAGATLGGAGTIRLLSTSTAAIAGILAPGQAGALGTLTMNGGKTDFSSGGSLLAQLNSNPAVFTSDLLSLTGAGSLTLGGSSILDLVGPAAFTIPGTYTLATFASGSLTGQFATVKYNGTTYNNPTTTNAVNSNGTLVYNADSIQLVVVPEPATLVLAGLGVGLAGLMLKHRRRPL